MIEPPYLRYVYDGLNKSSLNAENAAALPHGFIGLYEQEFAQKTPVSEREIVLNQLTLWALFKSPVSTNLAATVLKIEEEQIKNLIDRYSAWFNSPESGKFQLYHDRLKLFLLSKNSDLQIDNFINIIIEFCENVLNNLTSSKSEFIVFTLENYVGFLKMGWIKHPDYYQKIKSYCFKKDIVILNYDYLASLNYFIFSLNDLFKISILLNNENDLIEIINRRIEIRNFLNEKLKDFNSHELNSFPLAYFNLGLAKNIIFYKQYFLIAFCKLSIRIKENRVTQSDIDNIFNILDPADYKKFFVDLTEITTGNFWKKFIDLLIENSIDCQVILNHLPDDFLKNKIYFKKNYFTINIEKSYNSLLKSNIKDFIIENLNMNSNSDCYSEYFSLIDDPLYFQDKLIELYEYASFKSNYKLLIDAIQVTSSNTHLSELVSIIINHSLDIQHEDLDNLYRNLSYNSLSIDYFKVIQRLKILFDRYLKSNDIKSMSSILLTLDRNSLEYYLDYCSEYYLNKKNDLGIEDLLIFLRQFFEDEIEFNNSIITNKLKHKREIVVLLNSVSEDDGLKKLNNIEDKKLNLQKSFFLECKLKKNINKSLYKFFSNKQVIDYIKNYKNYTNYKNLNFTKSKYIKSLIYTAESRIQKIIEDSLSLDKQRSLNASIQISDEYIISLNQKISKLLISKLEYKLNDFEDLSCLYTLTHLNFFIPISNYLEEILLSNGFYNYELNFFKSKPSVNVLFELMIGYDLKNQLYEFLFEKEIFRSYKLLIIQVIHGSKIYNPIKYLDDLKNINEENLNEMFYELGLKLDIINLNRELLKQINKNHLKDFLNGLIDNSISNGYDTVFLLKTLLFNFLSIEEIQSILIDELIIFERLSKKNVFEGQKYICEKLNNYHITKILIKL